MSTVDDAGALFDVVLLDDSSDDEDRGDSSEDEDEGSGVSEAMVVGAIADEIDVNEGIEAPRLFYEGCETAVPLQAGCVWMRNDWSCASAAWFSWPFSPSIGSHPQVGVATGSSNPQSGLCD